MNGLLVEATLHGASEAVAGAPDEMKEFVHVISTNRAGLGAVAGVEAGSYFALGDAAAATFGAFVSEFVIPAAVVGYSAWRIYEGGKAASDYMDQHASQCGPL